MNPGDFTTITCIVTDPATGGLADPGLVTGRVTLPDGSISALTVVRASTGTYTASFGWTQERDDVIEFTGTTPYPFVRAIHYFVSPVA